MVLKIMGMHVKQTILVIGSGAQGKAIAASLANGNYHVLLSDKDFAKAEALVNGLKHDRQHCDVEAMQCFFDSAWESDMILLALCFSEQKEVATTIKEVVNQKILVSLVDPGASEKGNEISAEKQAGLLQQLLPNTKIVQLETADPGTDHTDCSKHLSGVILSGNDEKALEIVSSMLASVGVKSLLTKALSNGEGVVKTL
ncbi:MAG: oxidoreductase [Ferruginibacter sp.]|nr:oxidoreductase [Ferruginibacter sp.]